MTCVIFSKRVGTYHKNYSQGKYNEIYYKRELFNKIVRILIMAC